MSLLTKEEHERADRFAERVVRNMAKISSKKRKKKGFKIRQYSFGSPIFRY